MPEYSSGNPFTYIYSMPDKAGNIFLLCCLCLIGIFALGIYYDYHHILLMHPKSQHMWRQCDCSMFAYNYYKYDANFFHPRLNNLIGIDGRQGAEFPIIYYVASILYRLFGFHDGLLRIIDTLIFLAGLIYLLRLSDKLISSSFYAVYLPLLVFSSPLIVYYANNFLPEVPAFSFSIISIYYYITYTATSGSKHMVLYILFASLAGLLKITFLFVPAVCLLHAFASRHQQAGFLKKSLFYLIPFVVTFAWYSWIKQYNIVHHNAYFLLHARSILQADSEDKQYTLARLYNEWRLVMYHAYFWPFAIISILFNLVMTVLKKAYQLLALQVILIIASVGTYLLFFLQFTDHDYYFVSILLNILSGIFLSFYLWQKYVDTKIGDIVLKIGLVILLILNIHHSKKVMQERYVNFKWDDNHETYYDIDKYLRKMGISEEEKIISLGEYSSGISLYFMQNRGWNGYDWTPVKVIDIVDDTLIDNYVSKGAKYVVIKKDALEKYNWLLPRLEPVGTFKEVNIYKIIR